MRSLVENTALAYAVVFPLLAILVIFQASQAVPTGRHRRRPRHRRRARYRWWIGLFVVPPLLLFIAVVTARFVILR